MAFICFYTFLLLHPYFALWFKSFPKAGRKSWEALIPIYNYAVVFKVTCNKPFWALLMLIPGVHLVMWMVANVSWLRRFGYNSAIDTAQGILFPYLLSFKATQENAIFGKETNWLNGKEVEDRKWGDHIVLFLCLPFLGHALAFLFGAMSREVPGAKSRIKEWGDSLLFALVAASIIRTYVFEPFQIPTGSMEKTLLVGDFLFVNKLAYGPKVPVTPLSYPLVHNIVPYLNIPSYTTFEKGTYTRLPGFGKVQVNDVVVFNYPSGDTSIVDPRVPDGLMGHDYHGIVNNEALYLFQLEKNIQNNVEVLRSKLANTNKTEVEKDSILNSEIGKVYQEYIDKQYIWKDKARKRLEQGIFPGGENGMRHGGLIARPVDKRENYIKRCVGIPGDWLEIKNSTLYRNDKPAARFPGMCLKYYISKKKVTFPSAEEMFNRYGLENAPDGSRHDFNDMDNEVYEMNLTRNEKKQIEKDFKIRLKRVRYPQYSDDKNATFNVFDAIDNLNYYPKDFKVNNTVSDFTRFQVPFKGQVVDFRKVDIAWYRRVITAYEGHRLEEKKDGIYIDGKKTNTYKIEMNYYWLMGDNRFNSADSRVWGFVPEDHVVGRASLVWFSKSAYIDSFLGIRFERIFKFIR
ncbi:MAG: hypothetical protein RL264_1063 [Bacteroidota bacterium]|jgi:signal peptidase I